jgi:cysteine-rich repeat protein
MMENFLMRTLRIGATALIALATAHCSTPPVSGDAGPDAAATPDVTPIDAAQDTARSDVAPAPDATPDATPDVVTARCGDGIINGADVCDDNNTMDGDGCSAMCQPEAGWSCTAASPSVCTARCGDGMRVGPEAAMNGCDDSNMMDGDGCSAMCAIERGFSCMGAPSVCSTGCGDGITAGMERCDDSNMRDGDGCSMSCAIEDGFTCMGAPSTCATRCGDGIVAGMERCDDNNEMDNDGCSAMCVVESGYECTGMPRSTCAPACGDGRLVGAETAMGRCDDNNRASGDGCSDMCTIESGFTCTGAPSACAAVCGDSMRVGAEVCDDGNLMTETACPYGTATCMRCNADCTMALSLTGDVCGDGRVNGMEECDDGFAFSGDGCSATCTREMGAACAGTPSVCRFTASYTGMPQTVANTNPSATDLPVDITASCRVADVTSTHQWSVNHTFASDLTIELLAPGGSALLHNRTGGGADLLGPYTFASLAVVWAPAGAPYAMGTYSAPSLNALVGSRANGTWTLRVRDFVDRDSGTISAHRVTVTCAPNRAPLVAMHRSCAEIRTANPMAADGVFLIDPDAAGPREPFDVYCDMTNGGWTLIFSSNATPTLIRTVEPARPMTASMLPVQAMRDLAAVSQQVHIRTAGQIATRSVTSEPGNFAILSLRAGLTINSNSPLRAAGDSTMGVWSGPMATTAANLWHGCGPAPFGASPLPTMYWACNNGDGAHIGPAHTGWTSGGAEENIEIYVR